MSNTFLTPNMSLIIPVPLVDPGPDWANNVNSSLTIVDSHNHSAGSGVQITPSGININADLPFNSSNNAIGLRSVRFSYQSSPISGAADVGCIYESGIDLYYNDGNGNQIRITQSGSVAGSSGTITGLPSGTASAAYSAVSGTFVFQQATATAANMDIGSLIVRYPGSYPTPSGNAIVIAAPSSLSGTYQLTLPSLPAQTNVMTLSSTGTLSSVTYDQVGQAMTSVGANAIANSITRATSTTAALGGVAVSASTGTFSTASTIYVGVTGTSISLTTGGNPVVVKLIPDGSGFSAISGGTTGGAVQFQNGAGQILEFTLNVIGGAGVSYPGLEAMDFPASGVSNYVVNVKNNGSGNTTVTRMIFVAYELH